jgi:hypothetical protein
VLVQQTQRLTQSTGADIWLLTTALVNEAGTIAA